MNRENLVLLGGLERLARAQNEVGKATLQDVLRAQIEQDRLRNEIVNLGGLAGSAAGPVQGGAGDGGGRASASGAGSF